MSKLPEEKKRKTQNDHYDNDSETDFEEEKSEENEDAASEAETIPLDSEMASASGSDSEDESVNGIDEDAETLLNAEQKLECRALFADHENFRLVRTRLNVLTAILAAKNADKKFTDYDFFPPRISAGDIGLFDLDYSPYLWMGIPDPNAAYAEIDYRQEESERHMAANIYIAYKLYKDRVAGYMDLLAEGALQEIRKIAKKENVAAFFTATTFFDAASNFHETSIYDYARDCGDSALIGVLDEFTKMAEHVRLVDSLSKKKVTRHERLSAVQRTREMPRALSPLPPQNSPQRMEVEAIKALLELTAPRRGPSSNC